MAEGSMDLVERVSLLESVHDWGSLADELEKVIAQESEPAHKADAHLRLGRLLDEKFLQGVKALKHFQDAYKLNPTLMHALELARSIYWELGKTNMVQKLLRAAAEERGRGDERAAPHPELGDVLADAGDLERAQATYARALGASGGTSDAARAGLTDAQLDETTWTDAVNALAQEADALQGAESANLYLRAARIARRFDATAVEGLLAHAYAAQPLDRQAASVYEGLLVGSDRSAALEEAQRVFLDALTQRARAQVAFRLGTRWATRHQNLEAGARLPRRSVQPRSVARSSVHFPSRLLGRERGQLGQGPWSGRTRERYAGRLALPRCAGRPRRVAPAGQSHAGACVVRAPREGRAIPPGRRSIRNADR